MSLWRTGNHCLNEDTLPNDIFSQMKAEAPLTNSEGLPRFIVRYNGPLCLGNFGKDRRLLFLYAGQSAQNRPFQYRITEAASHNIVVDKQQLPYVYLPIPLDAKKYTVNVERDGQELGPWNIDLSAYESRLIWLDQSDNDPKSVGKFGEVMVDTAERNGSSSGLVNALWVRTEAAYSIAGSERDVQRIKAKLKTLDAKGLAEARAAWSNNFPTHVASDASTNEMNGKFAQASNLWISAAEIDRSTNDKQRFAKHAYFDSIAAGDPKTAEKVQGTYKLDIPTGKVFTTSKTTVVTGWANILLDAAGEGLPAR